MLQYINSMDDPPIPYPTCLPTPFEHLKAFILLLRMLSFFTNTHTHKKTSANRGAKNQNKLNLHPALSHTHTDSQRIASSSPVCTRSINIYTNFNANQILAWQDAIYSSTNPGRPPSPFGGFFTSSAPFSADDDAAAAVSLRSEEIYDRKQRTSLLASCKHDRGSSIFVAF